MIEPHCEPSRAETIAATARRRAPRPACGRSAGRRRPGSSQTPYMNACAGGNAAKAAPVAAQSRFHAQKTTPKATPEDGGDDDVDGAPAAAGRHRLGGIVDDGRTA